MTAEEAEGREIEEGIGSVPENDFTSPAIGAEYEPDLSRFDPDERAQIEALIGRNPY